MNELSGDELIFFDKMPSMLPVYTRLRQAVLERCPGTSIKVSRSQISFRSKYIYAMASLPVRRRKDWPEICLMVSFGLAVSYQGYVSTHLRAEAEHLRPSAGKGVSV